MSVLERHPVSETRLVAHSKHHSGRGLHLRKGDILDKTDGLTFVIIALTLVALMLAIIV